MPAKSMDVKENGIRIKIAILKIKIIAKYKIVSFLSIFNPPVNQRNNKSGK